MSFVPSLRFAAPLGAGTHPIAPGTIAIVDGTASPTIELPTAPVENDIVAILDQPFGPPPYTWTIDAGTATIQSPLDPPTGPPGTTVTMDARGAFRMFSWRYNAGFSAWVLMSGVAYTGDWPAALALGNEAGDNNPGLGAGGATTSEPLIYYSDAQPVRQGGVATNGNEARSGAWTTWRGIPPTTGSGGGPVQIGTDIADVFTGPFVGPDQGLINNLVAVTLEGWRREGNTSPGVYDYVYKRELWTMTGGGSKVVDIVAPIAINGLTGGAGTASSLTLGAGGAGGGVALFAADGAAATTFEAHARIDVVPITGIDGV